MKVPIFDLRVSDIDLKDELLGCVSQVLDHGRLFLGPEVEEFEYEICQHIGSKYAVGVASGSSALYLALKANGIGPGDEVVTTPLTWIISSNAIKACGATPVFADVNDDFNINPKSIEEMIGPKTRAIVPVHYAGQMCDMKSISAIAAANDLLVIEDAAQAFGASINGKNAGTFSAAAGFSMNPMKALGGYGEAGVVVTDDQSVYDRLKRLRHAGTTSDPKKVITNYCEEVSLNHKMDTVNAAMLLVALKHWPARQKRREEIAQVFRNRLHPDVQSQRALPNHIHARYVYPIRIAARDDLKNFLEESDIETKIMHEPLVPEAPAYLNSRSVVKNARQVLDSSLVIPSHEKLLDIHIEYIINKINEFFNHRL
jgi:dTDP-4-amino-4,6-dideoxygalactose transaminase